MRTQHVCPHCDQDWLRRFRILATGEVIHLCRECESLWREGDDLTQRAGHYLGEYLDEPDPARHWSGIEEIP